MEIKVNATRMVRESFSFIVDPINYAQLRSLPLATTVFHKNDGEWVEGTIAEHDWNKKNQGENVRVQYNRGSRIARPTDKYPEFYIEKNPLQA